MSFLLAIKPQCFRSDQKTNVFQNLSSSLYLRKEIKDKSIWLCKVNILQVLFPYMWLELSKKRCTRGVSFREYESQLSPALILENELPSVPRSLAPSWLCLIAVFICPFGLDSGCTLLSPHMFSIVWIKVKWIVGHQCDWDCFTLV